MSDLLTYGEQFEKIVDIIESAKERAYRKVNEELILMYRDIGEYISLQSENAEYGDAFVQKLADFFATNYPDLKGFNRKEVEILTDITTLLKERLKDDKTKSFYELCEKTAGKGITKTICILFCYVHFHPNKS